MTRPLVSVLTPTWQRHQLLLKTIENVRWQTYRPLEHVIVSDGPDPTVRDTLDDDIQMGGWGGHTRIVWVPLGRNWTTFLGPGFYAQMPLFVAMLVASGEYQVWLADDEEMEPDHIATLVDALEISGADFAYSQTRMYHKGQSPDQGWTIGTPTPAHGQITNVLYRTDLLKRGLYQFGDDRASDWATINTWIDAGATWAYVPRVTFTHRADR